MKVYLFTRGERVLIVRSKYTEGRAGRFSEMYSDPPPGEYWAGFCRDVEEVSYRYVALSPDDPMSYPPCSYATDLAVGDSCLVVHGMPWGFCSELLPLRSAILYRSVLVAGTGARCDLTTFIELIARDVKRSATSSWLSAPRSPRH